MAIPSRKGLNPSRFYRCFAVHAKLCVQTDGEQRQDEWSARYDELAKDEVGVELKEAVRVMALVAAPGTRSRRQPQFEKPTRWLRTNGCRKPTPANLTLLRLGKAILKSIVQRTIWMGREW